MVGYKVNKIETAAWILVHSIQGGNETLYEEPIEETRSKENLILEHELHVDEALQLQYS